MVCISDDTFKEIKSMGEAITKMLNSLIKSVKIVVVHNVSSRYLTAQELTSLSPD
jgi:hypothetical protein